MFWEKSSGNLKSQCHFLIAVRSFWKTLAQHKTRYLKINTIILFYFLYNRRAFKVMHFLRRPVLVFLFIIIYMCIVAGLVNCVKRIIVCGWNVASSMPTELHVSEVSSLQFIWFKQNNNLLACHQIYKKQKKKKNG